MFKKKNKRRNPLALVGPAMFPGALGHIHGHGALGRPGYPPWGNPYDTRIKNRHRNRVGFQSGLQRRGMQYMNRPIFPHRAPLEDRVLPRFFHGPRMGSSFMGRLVPGFQSSMGLGYRRRSPLFNYRPLRLQHPRPSYGYSAFSPPAARPYYHPYRRGYPPWPQSRGSSCQSTHSYIEDEDYYSDDDDDDDEYEAMTPRYYTEAEEDDWSLSHQHYGNWDSYYEEDDYYGDEEYDPDIDDDDEEDFDAPPHGYGYGHQWQDRY